MGVEHGKGYLVYPCVEGWCVVTIDVTHAIQSPDVLAFTYLGEALKAIAARESDEARAARSAAGGKAAAAVLTPEERSDRARIAAHARWDAKKTDALFEREPDA